jgi:hypothetical protein
MLVIHKNSGVYIQLLRRVCKAIVAVRKQEALLILSLCVCVRKREGGRERERERDLRYSACKAWRCHLWPVRLCNIFPRYLIKVGIFGEKS